MLNYLILFFIATIQFSTFGQSLKQDFSFGNKGEIYFTNGRYNEVKDIVVSPDNSFFVLIESGKIDSLRDMDIVVLKFSAQGKPDLKFGKKGQLIFDFYGMNISRAGELKLLPDGKLLIAGDGGRNSLPDVNLSCLIRLFPDGTIDRSFGKEGTLAIAFDKGSYLSALHIINDTSVFVAGNCLQPFGNHIDVFPVMGKVNFNGKADSGFGKTGKIWIDFYQGIFSLVSIKHTAGGEIKDILVQDDGKILICGGYLFHYTYEGFIARLMPDGTFDKSFNSKGYIKYDCTPGKFNEITRMLLYDSNTLIFGASSNTDYDCDFYFGVMNLKDAKFSMTKIDFKGQHDIFEDMSLDKGKVILSGRSILPENVERHHRSDFSAIVKINDINHPDSYEPMIFSLSKENQNGIMGHAIIQDRLIVAGFVLTSNVFVKDVVISCFKNKK